jgi:hypothetical protein
MKERERKKKKKKEMGTGQYAMATGFYFSSLLINKKQRNAGCSLLGEILICQCHYPNSRLQLQPCWKLGGLN